jgi:DUF1680 family protein
MPSIPGYGYASQGDTLYINLFVQGKGKIDLENTVVHISQDTRYPWDGKIKIAINPEKSAEFSVRIRIPGWSRNQPIPSDLYSYLRKSPESPILKVNSELVAPDTDKGYASIRRKWKKGDVVELTLPMPVQKIVSHEMVRDNKGKVALQRGPLVYCLEAVDNGEHVLDRTIPDDSEFTPEFRSNLLGGITVLKSRDRDESEGIIAIPYYAWSHRGIGEMAVWLPRK